MAALKIAGFVVLAADAILLLAKIILSVMERAAYDGTTAAVGTKIRFDTFLFYYTAKPSNWSLLDKTVVFWPKDAKSFECAFSTFSDYKKYIRFKKKLDRAEEELEDGRAYARFWEKINQTYYNGAAARLCLTEIKRREIPNSRLENMAFRMMKETKEEGGKDCV